MVHYTTVICGPRGTKRRRLAATLLPGARFVAHPEVSFLYALRDYKGDTLRLVLDVSDMEFLLPAALAYSRYLDLVVICTRRPKTPLIMHCGHVYLTGATGVMDEWRGRLGVAWSRPRWHAYCAVAFASRRYVHINWETMDPTHRVSRHLFPVPRPASPPMDPSPDQARTVAAAARSLASLDDDAHK